jgi:hypothetical protein
VWYKEALQGADTIDKMQLRNQIRRWHRLSLPAVLSLAGFAVAGDTPATVTQPASKSHPATTKRTSTPSSAKSSKGAHGKKGSKQTARKRGQQAIDSTRAREIQSALIREHYMPGQPSGAWDSTTQAAMRRYQADQGWQSKTTPDARALIKLGLGPSHDHLLNPESAMTTSSGPAPADSKAAAKQTPRDNNFSQK